MVECSERRFDCDCSVCIECDNFDDCQHREALEILADIRHDETMSRDADDEEYEYYKSICWDD